MEWTEEGIILSVLRRGESSGVITLLTRERGKHAGLIRSLVDKSLRGLYQPGNLVHAEWRARLEEHLGFYKCEMITAYSAPLLNDGDRLAGLSSVCALVDSALPEREAHPKLYSRFLDLLGYLSGPDWPAHYIAFELDLLSDLGFGLDLSHCAATGDIKDLVYVSPKTGRAVSAVAGEPYKERLLELPRFLTNRSGNSAEITSEAMSQGFHLTGFFLERHVFQPHNRKIPQARSRLVERLTNRLRTNAKS